MSVQKPCFLPATEPAYGVRRAKELLAVQVIEVHLAQLACPNPQVNAVVTLPLEERGATLTCSARSQAPRTREGLL